MDNDLKTHKFPTGTVQRGSPEVPSKEQEVGVPYGDSTPSYLQSKRSFLFSEVHFRTGTAFPCFSSARIWEKHFPQNGGDQPGGPVNSLTSGSQHCCPLGSRQPILERNSGLDHRTKALAPTSLPRQPQGGRGGSVVSFPLHLGFFFHFIED